MTARSSNSEDRQVIPRWRLFAETLATGELSALTSAPRESVEKELQALRAAHVETPNLYTAADLLSALIASGAASAEVDDLTEALLVDGRIPRPLQSMLSGPLNRAGNIAESAHLTMDSSGSRAMTTVRQLRTRLPKFPRNAVSWVDLALAYTTLGLNTKAERAMETALALAPHSRFVLRSASRLFVHLGEFDRAYTVLSENPRTSQDPWLLAAELSTSQLAFGRFANIRVAREALASRSFSPLALSELASEVATGEVYSGHDKRARHLFAQALIHPNENAVAQAASLAEKGDLRLDPAIFEINRGFEARAITHAQHAAWSLATEEARRWHEDEPFALDPVTFGSYAAALGAADYETALALAENGLRAHPDEPVLRNNAAFSLANLNRTAEARGHLDHIRTGSSDPDADIYLATEGLVLFREGSLLAGRSAYQRAIEGLVRANRESTGAIAAILWAAEETRLQTPIAPQAVRLAREGADRFPTPESQTLIERLDQIAASNAGGESSPGAV